MPKVVFLSGIRSKAFFASRRRYDLYMDGVLLVETLIDDCETCGTLLQKGYGNGICGREDCAAASEKLNGPYSGLKSAVADFDLLSVINNGDFCPPEYFWDVTKEPILGSILPSETVYYLSTLRSLGIKNDVVREQPLTSFLDEIQRKVTYNTNLL